MESLENFFINPIAASFFGWLAWNVVMFRIEKDGYDLQKIKFPLGEYFSRTWDNWIASFVMIPILLFVGFKKLNIEFDSNNLQWNDLYYVLSGFITEVVIVSWEKWKNKK